MTARVILALAVAAVWAPAAVQATELRRLSLSAGYAMADTSSRSSTSESTTVLETSQSGYSASLRFLWLADGVPTPVRGKMGVEGELLLGSVGDGQVKLYQTRFGNDPPMNLSGGSGSDGSFRGGVFVGFPVQFLDTSWLSAAAGIGLSLGHTGSILGRADILHMPAIARVWTDLAGVPVRFETDYQLVPLVFSDARKTQREFDLRLFVKLWRVEFGGAYRHVSRISTVTAGLNTQHSENATDVITATAGLAF